MKKRVKRATSSSSAQEIFRGVPEKSRGKNKSFGGKVCVAVVIENGRQLWAENSRIGLTEEEIVEVEEIFFSFLEEIVIIVIKFAAAPSDGNERRKIEESPNCQSPGERWKIVFGQKQPKRFTLSRHVKTHRSEWQP